jgi:hypothetical protein
MYAADFHGDVIRTGIAGVMDEPVITSLKDENLWFILSTVKLC